MDHQDATEIDWPGLTPSQGRVLDALLEAGYQSTGVTHGTGSTGGKANTVNTGHMARAGALADLNVTTEAGAAVSRVLALLERWPVPEASPGLDGRALAAVLSSAPVSLSPGDAAVLDALLAHRRAGLSTGPMPVGDAARSARVNALLGVLDCSSGVGELAGPHGLAARTINAVGVARDRESARAGRLFGGVEVCASGASGRVRWGGGSIRQLGAVAAVLVLMMSVLLPVLDRGKRDAQVAQCAKNLSGLGAGLAGFSEMGAGRSLAGSSGKPASPEIFRELSSFARGGLDGVELPASRASLFVLLDKKYVQAEALSCPAASDQGALAYYNGQNPAAGGPIRIFRELRPVFSDTNPLYRVTPRGLVRNSAVPASTPSANHGGTGQNLLMSDGSVAWKARPAQSRALGQGDDHFWLFDPIDTDAPADQDAPDVFLTP